MPIEIEAKMSLHDPAALEARLTAVGAESLGIVLETNTYFDTTRADLMSTDQGLRIRVREDHSGNVSATITHTGPRAHGRLKSRLEAECGIDDPRAMAEVLQGLGYRPTFNFEKVRSSWRLDECAVEIDTLPQLGSFLEIEGPTDTAVMSVRARAGMAEVPLIRSSYIAMLSSYIRENRMTSDVIGFEERPSLAG